MGRCRGMPTIRQTSVDCSSTLRSCFLNADPCRQTAVLRSAVRDRDRRPWSACTAVVDFTIEQAIHWVLSALRRSRCRRFHHLDEPRPHGTRSKIRRRGTARPRQVALQDRTWQTSQRQSGRMTLRRIHVLHGRCRSFVIALGIAVSEAARRTQTFCQAPYPSRDGTRAVTIRRHGC